MFRILQNKIIIIVESICNRVNHKTYKGGMIMKARRLIASVLCLLLAVSLSIPALANESTARNISIFEIDGENARLSRGAARSVVPRQGQRLSAGNTLITGRNTNIFLRLDNDSILKMDQLSRISVSSTSRNRLSLTVQSGNALVYADPQTARQPLETRIGNTSLTVRGTMYVIGRDMDGTLNIAMLSGSGDVNGIELPAGSVITVSTEDNELLVRDLQLEDLNSFTLSSILDNSAYLLAQGDTFEPCIVTTLPLLIEQSFELEQESFAAATVVPEIEHVRLLPENPPTPLVVIPHDDSAQEEESNSPSWSDFLSLPPIFQFPERDEPYIPGEPEEPIEPDEPDMPGGDGTPSNPYLIDSFEKLKWITNPAYPERLGMNYRLTANITAPNGFMIPEPFSGTFDGNMHTISLTLSSIISVNSGLFSTIAPTGVVENLSVGGITHGINNIGGIAKVNYGLIENSNFTGVSFGSTTVGGIVGTNNGTIRYSFSEALVIGNSHVGGIAGDNSGTIEKSHSSNTVTGTGCCIGGIVGNNTGLIENVFSTANVSAASAQNVGGVVGRNRSTVNNVFSTGAVSGSSNVGGLVGLNNSALSNSVAINNDLTTASNFDYIANGIPAANSFAYETMSLTSDLLLPLWWQGMLGWSPSVWSFSANLPTLHNVGGIQNPMLPAILAIPRPRFIEEIGYPDYDSDDEDESDESDESDSEDESEDESDDESDYTDDSGTDDHPYEPEDDNYYINESTEA